jgi:phage I-like protein
MNQENRNPIVPEKENLSLLLRSCFPDSFILSNEEVENIAQKVEGVANEFEVLQGDWVQVAPYGAFPHQMGLQYFDRSDADNLVANFKSLTAKLLRRFGGLPWYEGHPDTSPKDYPNKRAYGWIDDVQARDEGLYGHVKWTRSGQDLISEGHYKFFSPVWHVTPANVGGKRVLRPDELISVGFTNMPNMPVLPLANVNEGENEMKLPTHLLKVLGFAEDASPTPEELQPAAEKLATDMEEMKTKCANVDATTEAAANEKTAADEALANTKTEFETALANEKKRADDAQAAAQNAQQQFDNERHERIELIVSTALAQGKITAADTDKWRGDLKEDFAGKSAELANAKPVIKTGAITANLGQREQAMEQGGTPGEQLKALANELVTSGKAKDFNAGWNLAKQQRPDLITAPQKTT